MNRFLQGWIEQLESQADSLVTQGDSRQAADLRRQLCDGIVRHLGEDAPLLIGHLESLGNSLRRADELEAAERVFRRRLRLVGKHHGHQRLSFARGVNQLGVLYCEMGRYRRAVSLYRRLLAGLEDWQEVDDAQRAALHHNLANAYQALRQRPQAVKHYEAASALLEHHGPSAEHAQCLCDMAESLAPDQPTRARQLLVEGLGEVRSVFVQAPTDLARALIRIAGSYFRMHHLAMADRLLQEAIVLLESAPREPGELRHCRGLLDRVRTLRESSGAI